MVRRGCAGLPLPVEKRFCPRWDQRTQIQAEVFRFHQNSKMRDDGLNLIRGKIKRSSIMVHNLASLEVNGSSRLIHVYVYQISIGGSKDSGIVWARQGSQFPTRDDLPLATCF